MIKQYFICQKLLLDLAKKLFEDQTSLDRMVIKIMMQATELVRCERCTVLLLDTFSNNKVSQLIIIRIIVLILL